MVQATREALSEIEAKKPVNKQDVLRLIPQFEILPLFLRRHLIKREILIGSTGDRGGGKSVQSAVTATVDGMFLGKTIHSNIDIAVDVEIDDDTAIKYGLNSGGTASFRSVKLEKDALLNLDERFIGAGLVIEEINVEYSNVRRFMSNTNVDFNEGCQQLRKFECPLYYNVIDEMFVDPQLRRMTDIFIKTYDTAFDVDSLEAKKPLGEEFCWFIYPMSAYLCGQQGKYELTKKPLGPVYFHFKAWQGVFNTNKYQKQGIYTMSTRDKNKVLKAKIGIEDSKENQQYNQRWGFLKDVALQLRDEGNTEVEPWELSNRVGKPLTREMRAALASYGVHYNRYSGNYTVEGFKFKE